MHNVTPSRLKTNCNHHFPTTKKLLQSLVNAFLRRPWTILFPVWWSNKLGSRSVISIYMPFWYFLKIFLSSSSCFQIFVAWLFLMNHLSSFVTPRSLAAWPFYHLSTTNTKYGIKYSVKIQWNKEYTKIQNTEGHIWMLT